MEYTTQHIQKFFQISHQTVKNYSKEFSEWLSEGANPGDRRQRFYNDDDLTVFALAAQMLKGGKEYSDVKAALLNGQRGEIPEKSLEQMPAVVSRQVLALRDKVIELQADKVALASEMDQQRGMVKLLKEQLAEKDTRIYDLMKQLARLEAK